MDVARAGCGFLVEALHQAGGSPGVRRPYSGETLLMNGQRLWNWLRNLIPSPACACAPARSPFPLYLPSPADWALQGGPGTMRATLGTQEQVAYRLQTFG